MSEMADRVAKAHWEARRTGFDIPRLAVHEVMEWDQLPQEFRDREIGAARSALEILREPTEKMMASRKAYTDAVYESGNAPTAIGAWRAMIDEALR